MLNHTSTGANLNRNAKEEFLTSVVMPSFYGSLNKEFIAAIYGLNNKLILATNYYSRMLGFNSYIEIQGKSHHEIDKLHSLPQHARLINATNGIRDKVIEMENIITYAEFIQYDDKFHANAVTHYPMFYTDGSVVAVGKVARPLKLFLNPSTYLDISEDISGVDTEVSIPADLAITGFLTQRQEEVLFLLMQNFSQKQIAKILEINRGSVSSHITLLCEKFGINGQSTPLLIQRAYKLGFLNKIPASLFKKSIFLLSHDNLAVPQTIH